MDVANPAQENTSGLMADLTAIVYSFTARMYGLHSAKRRTAQVKAVLAAPLPELDDAPTPDGGATP